MRTSSLVREILVANGKRSVEADRIERAGKGFWAYLGPVIQDEAVVAFHEQCKHSQASLEKYATKAFRTASSNEVDDRQAEATRYHDAIAQELQACWEDVVIDALPNLTLEELKGMSRGDCQGCQTHVVFTRQKYFRLYDKLVHVLFGEQHDQQDLMISADKDWRRDVGLHAKAMTREMFINSWFELADAWTEGTAPIEFVAFLKNLRAHLSIVSKTTPGKWRDEQRRLQHFRAPLPKGEMIWIPFGESHYIGSHREIAKKILAQTPHERKRRSSLWNLAGITGREPQPADDTLIEPQPMSAHRSSSARTRNRASSARGRVLPCEARTISSAHNVIFPSPPACDPHMNKIGLGGTPAQLSALLHQLRGYRYESEQALAKHVVLDQWAAQQRAATLARRDNAQFAGGAARHLLQRGQEATMQREARRPDQLATYKNGAVACKGTHTSTSRLQGRLRMEALDRLREQRHAFEFISR
mmetsp:Transcript_26348/g.43765  ORF Transcript_26348/g.43765 Transcript_26348/m.43765 type:complete len:474 (+) Transcript_26348:24-1445(+)